MLTKPVILALINNLETNFNTELEMLKEQLFALYDKDKKVIEFLNDAENCNNLDYSIDQYGELVSFYSPKFNLAGYPYFNEYISQNHFGSWDSKNEILIQCHGEYIAINWNCSSREYFIYDNKKPIIKDKLEWMDEKYVAAFIAQYQNEEGIFGDIIEVDYYGCYVKHFNPMDYLAGLVENLDDKKGLQKIIDNYNKNNELEAE
jgi:hypothetical protein